MMNNPALSAFMASLGTELVFGQVLLQRKERGFELRHVADREIESASLQLIEDGALRRMVQFTVGGNFRPLKSAPHLQRGWRNTPVDSEALGDALSILYPGAVADWLAAQAPKPPITSYREFTNRQTGMYRLTAMLDDATAGAVIRACCHYDFCLKRRLWSVPGLETDGVEVKSIIPCLEPCAILLEFARKMARLEQGSETPASSAPDFTLPETDFDQPANPRRVRFVLEKTVGAGTSTLV